jgi:hypothetical protein
MSESTRKEPTVDDASDRIRKAQAEIDEVLERHRCYIRPMLEVKPIGNDGSEMMTRAGYIIQAEPSDDR